MKRLRDSRLDSMNQINEANSNSNNHSVKSKFEHTVQVLTTIISMKLQHVGVCHIKGFVNSARHRHHSYKDFKGIHMITPLSDPDKIQIDISNDVACHTRKRIRIDSNFWKKRGNDEGGGACFHTWRNLNRRQSSALDPLSSPLVWLSSLVCQRVRMHRWSFNVPTPTITFS